MSELVTQPNVKWQAFEKHENKRKRSNSLFRMCLTCGFAVTNFALSLDGVDFFG